jgi:hypothetical protein
MKRTLFLFLPLAALGQEMSGPTLGWSPADDGRSLRVIYGVAGAARMGTAVAFPEELTGVTVSPSGQRAVAMADGVAVLVNLVTLHRTALPGGSRYDQAVWSPSGTALLLTNHENGLLKTYVQHGNQFDAVVEVALTAESYAVSDDGTAILAAAGEELLLRTAEGSSVAGPKTTGFTFLARTHTAVFTDGAELVIGGNRFALPAESVLLESPAAGRILAIDRAAGKLIWFDDQGTRLAEASCQCEVSRVERLGTAGTLRLVTTGDGPAWLTETSSTTNRLFFVPTSEPNTEPIAESTGEVKQ